MCFVCYAFCVVMMMMIVVGYGGGGKNIKILVMFPLFVTQNRVERELKMEENQPAKGMEMVVKSS